MATAPVNFTLTATDNASTKLALLKAKIEGLTAPVDAIKSKFAGMSQAMNLGGVSSALTNLRAQFAQSATMVGAGGLIAAGGIMAVTSAMVRNTIATTDNLGKLQDLHERYKVGTDMLQVYKAMGAEAGVEVESLAKAHGFLAQKLAAAAGGDKGAIAKLQGVGIDKVDLNKSVESVFAEIADVFKKSTKSSDDILKIDFAKDIFGKAGIDIIPILEKGPEAFKKSLEDLKATGRLFSAEQVKAADDSGDAWTRAKGIMQGLKDQIGLATLPMLDALSGAIEKAFTGSGRDKLVQVFTQLGDKLAILLPQLIDKLPQVAESISNITGKILAFGNFVGWENLMLGGFIMLASPFIMSAGGLVLALGKVAFSIGVVAFNAVSASGAIPALAASVRAFALGTAIASSTGVAGFLAFLGPIALVVAAVATVAAAAYWIYNNWSGVSSFFSGMWQTIAMAFEPIKPIFDWMGDKLGQLMGWLGELLGITGSSSAGFQDWSNSGRTAGAYIATALQAVMQVVYDVIDSFAKLGAVWDFINGKGYNFVSSRPKEVDFFAEAKRINESADVQELKRFANQRNSTIAGTGLELPSIASTANPVAKAQLAAAAKQDTSMPAVQAAVAAQQQRATFDGNIKIHVTSDGKPQVKEATTGVPGVGMNVSNGMMFAG